MRCELCSRPLARSPLSGTSAQPRRRRRPSSHRSEPGTSPPGAADISGKRGRRRVTRTRGPRFEQSFSMPNLGETPKLFAGDRTRRPSAVFLERSRNAAWSRSPLPEGEGALEKAKSEGVPRNFDLFAPGARLISCFPIDLLKENRSGVSDPYLLFPPESHGDLRSHLPT